MFGQYRYYEIQGLYLMRRAVRVRVYPDEEQNSALVAQWGAVRFVWNKGLHAMSHYWRFKQTSLHPKHDLKKILKTAKKSPRYEWLKKHDSMALQQALINLGKARQAFFEKRAKYPKFKGRHDAQSSYHCTGAIGWGIDDACHLKGNGWISLPKMKTNIRAHIHRDIADDWALKSITMKKTKTGKVFATLLFETGKDAPDLPKVVAEDDIVGGDLGLKDFLVTSRGEKTTNPRHLLRATKRLRRRQKSLSRKKRGSANRAKAREKLARAHEDLANARSDFLHKKSRWFVDDSQATGLETLRVKNMMRNRKLAKAIGDVAWGEFTRQVCYKSIWAGKPHVRIDPFEPSTKRCAPCQAINGNLTLKDRVWTCPGCGAVHDRDINAAENIRNVTIIELRAQGYGVRRKAPRAP